MWTKLYSLILLANGIVFFSTNIFADNIFDNNVFDNINDNIPSNATNNIAGKNTEGGEAKTKTYFRVGTQDFDYSPQYNFVSATDKGFAWAVLESFAKKEGIEFKYVPLPLKRLQSELKKGNIDFVYPDNQRWHKGEKNHLKNKTFSDELTMAVYGTMVQKQRKGIGLENFRSVTYPKGFVPTKWQQLFEQDKLQLVETSTAELAIKMVLRGRADGADIEYSVTQFILQNLDRPGELVLDETLPFTTVGFQLATIQYHDTIYRLNQFLANNKDLLNELHQRYGLTSKISNTKEH